MQSLTILDVTYEFSLTVEKRFETEVPDGYRLVGKTDSGRSLFVNITDGSLAEGMQLILLAPSIRVFFELSRHIDSIDSAPVPQLYKRAFQRLLEHEYPELLVGSYWPGVLATLNVGS